MWRKMNQGLISKPSASGKIRGNHLQTQQRASSVAAPSSFGYFDNLGMPDVPPQLPPPASTSESYLKHMRNNNSTTTSTESRRKRRRKSKPRCNKNNRLVNQDYCGGRYFINYYELN